MIVLCLYAPLALYFALLAMGAIRWRRLDTEQKLIPVYEALCIATTLGIEVLKACHVSVTLLVHVFSPLQTLLFGEMFAHGTSSRRFRLTIRCVVAGYLLFWLTWLVLRGGASFQSYRTPVFHVHTIANLLLALSALGERSREYRIPLTSQATFWLASGLLLDSALCLIFYPVRDWLIANRFQVLLLFSGFHASWVMLTHLLFGKALLCPPRMRSS
jgi:hypothetical protein